MGKLLSKNFKNKAEKLFQIYPEKFKDDFGANKSILSQELKLPYSKTIINLMAGYLCRFARVQSEKEEIVVQKFEQPQTPQEDA